MRGRDAASRSSGDAETEEVIGIVERFRIPLVETGRGRHQEVEQKFVDLALWVNRSINDPKDRARIIEKLEEAMVVGSLSVVRRGWRSRELQ